MANAWVACESTVLLDRTRLRNSFELPSPLPLMLLQFSDSNSLQSSFSTLIYFSLSFSQTLADRIHEGFSVDYSSVSANDSLHLARVSFEELVHWASRSRSQNEDGSWYRAVPLGVNTFRENFIPVTYLRYRGYYLFWNWIRRKLLLDDLKRIIGYCFMK